jgi:hypothetical protein
MMAARRASGPSAPRSCGWRIDPDCGLRNRGIPMWIGANELLPSSTAAREGLSRNIDLGLEGYAPS